MLCVTCRLRRLQNTLLLTIQRRLSFKFTKKKREQYYVCHNIIQ